MSSSNTYPKSPEDIMRAMPQGQASLFQDTMDSLPPENQATLRSTLARLPDDRFDAITSHLTYALPGHLRHYVYILGVYDNTIVNQSKAVNSGTVQRQEANNASVLSSKELRVGIQKLPQEIRDEIELAFIKSALAPGCIFPDQAPGPDGKHFFLGERFEPTKYEVLLGLNRANYQLHSVHFWSNLFVIGGGPVWDSMRWLERMHDNIQAKLRNVYISLSRDADKPIRSATGEKYVPWPTYRVPTYREYAAHDPGELMQNFDNEVTFFNSNLRKRWRQKFSCLEHLELENLIIDVRDAFGLDDSFLGDGFMRTMPRFVKKPQSVKVIANDDASAAALLSIFWARNP